MPIVKTQGYQLDSPQQNFVRDSFPTLADMLAYDTAMLPPVFHSMVDEDGKLYTYWENNEVDPVLGKWRLGAGGGQGGDTLNVDELPDPSSCQEGDLVNVRQDVYSEPEYLGSDDAAYNINPKTHIPYVEEWQQLLRECTYEFTYWGDEDVKVLKLISRTTGNELILPLAGAVCDSYEKSNPKHFNDWGMYATKSVCNASFSPYVKDYSACYDFRIMIHDDWEVVNQVKISGHPRYYGVSVRSFANEALPGFIKMCSNIWVAEANIGAELHVSRPQNIYGRYYAFGEVSARTSYEIKDNRYYNVTSGKYTKYTEEDGKVNLENEAWSEPVFLYKKGLYRLNDSHWIPEIEDKYNHTNFPLASEYEEGDEINVRCVTGPYVDIDPEPGVFRKVNGQWERSDKHNFNKLPRPYRFGEGSEINIKSQYTENGVVYEAGVYRLVNGVWVKKEYGKSFDLDELPDPSEYTEGDVINLRENIYEESEIIHKAGLYKLINGQWNSNFYESESLPIGSIVAFGGINPPIGYLLCNGANVSRTLYSDLFNAIGTAYGEGDGTTTFTLPDLRESTIVGAGQNTTNTIASHDVYNLGEFKDDQLQGHIHHSQANIDYNASSQSASDMYAHALRNHWNSMNNTARQTYLTDNLHGTPRIGDTTHGKQTGCNYIIKYCKHVTPYQEAMIDDNTINGNTTWSSLKIKEKTETWVDISDKFTLTKQAGSASYTITKKSAWICGGLVKFRICVVFNSSGKAGTNPLDFIVSSNLFSITENSYTFCVSYYGGNLWSSRLDTTGQLRFRPNHDFVGGEDAEFSGLVTVNLNN